MLSSRLVRRGSLTWASARDAQPGRAGGRGRGPRQFSPGQRPGGQRGRTRSGFGNHRQGPTRCAECESWPASCSAPPSTSSAPHQELAARKTFTLHEGEEIRIGGTPLGHAGVLLRSGRAGSAGNPGQPVRPGGQPRGPITFACRAGPSASVSCLRTCSLPEKEEGACVCCAVCRFRGSRRKNFAM